MRQSLQRSFQMQVPQDLHLSGDTPSSGQCSHLQSQCPRAPCSAPNGCSSIHRGSPPGWRFQFIYSNTDTKSRAAAHQAHRHLQCCHSRQAILAGPALGRVPGGLWAQHGWPASVMSCTGHNRTSAATSLSKPLTKPWPICPTCHVGFLAERTSDGSFSLSLENWSGFLFFCLLTSGPGCCVLIFLILS